MQSKDIEKSMHTYRELPPSYILLLQSMTEDKIPHSWSSIYNLIKWNI